MNVRPARGRTFAASDRILENDNGKIDAVVNTWNRVADLANVPVELVRRVRKVSGGDVTIDDALGAGARKVRLGMSRTLDVMIGEDAVCANMPPEERRSYVRVDADRGSSMQSRISLGCWFALIPSSSHSKK